MNVLCINYEYPPVGGGGAPACQGICEAVVRAGHPVHVVTSAMPDLPTHEVRNGVEIHRTACRRRHRHYTTTLEMVTGLRPATKRAIELAGAQPFDLIHCHFVVPSGIVAMRVARRTGLPVVITAHGSDIPGYNPDRFAVMHHLIRPWWRSILRHADAVTTPSQFLGDLLRHRIDVPVDVIPVGFEPPHFDEPIARRKSLLVATRMFKRKGVQHVIRALQGIDHDWEVLIAGDGPYLDTIKALAAECGVKARFLGMVSRQELARLYRTAMVFVFPSSRENFPMVLLEAMAGGCAVVTSTAAGCSEVVGDAAIRVDTDDVPALRAALERLLHDEAQVTRLRTAAQERIKTFAWSRVAGKYAALYERVLQRRQEASATPETASARTSR